MAEVISMEALVWLSDIFGEHADTFNAIIIEAL